MGFAIWPRETQQISNVTVACCPSRQSPTERHPSHAAERSGHPRCLTSVRRPTGVQLRGPEGAQRPRASSAATSEFGGVRCEQSDNLRVATSTPPWSRSSEPTNHNPEGGQVRTARLDAISTPPSGGAFWSSCQPARASAWTGDCSTSIQRQHVYPAWSTRRLAARSSQSPRQHHETV